MSAVIPTHRETIRQAISELGGRANLSELAFYLQNDMPEATIKATLEQMWEDCELVRHIMPSEDDYILHG